MFKMVSESFIHALLLFLGLFLEFLNGYPCVLGSFGVVFIAAFFFLAELNRSIQIVVNYNNFLYV